MQFYLKKSDPTNQVIRSVVVQWVTWLPYTISIYVWTSALVTDCAVLHIIFINHVTYTKTNEVNCI